MFNEFMSDLTLFIPFIITVVAVVGVGAYATYKDFKKLKVKVWLLLLMPLIAFTGVITARIINGTFQWYFLLIIPVYVLLEYLNVKYNTNRFIGQGDVDILAASVALAVPIVIGLMNVTYPTVEGIDVPTTSANIAQVFSFFLSSLAWLLVGYIGTLILFTIIFAIKRAIKGKSKTSLRKTKVPIILGYIPLLLWMIYAAIYVII